MSHTNKNDIEQAIQSEVCNRFHLGHEAPIANGLLGHELRYLHNLDIAYAILNGTYIAPNYIDDATKMMLSEIGKLGTSVLDRNNPDKIQFMGDDFIT